FIFPNDADQALTLSESRASAYVLETGALLATRRITSALLPRRSRQTLVQNDTPFPIMWAWATGAAVTIPSRSLGGVSSDGTDAVLVSLVFTDRSLNESFVELTADQSTNSAAFVDLFPLPALLTTTGGDIVVLATVAASVSDGVTEVFFRVTVDGVVAANG